MRHALRNIAVLGGLTVIAGAALAWFAAWTADDVAGNRAAAESRILRELAGVDVAATSGDLLLCERGFAVLRGFGTGYGGAFQLAVAVGADGTVQGVRVIDHQETPGFADIIAAGSPWLESFRSGDVHAVTGATVTSRAVMAAVQRAVDRMAGEGLCR